MPQKAEFDIIFFGMGYSGKCIILEFIQSNEKNYTWAVAGRSVNKLVKLLQWASAQTGTYLQYVLF